MTIGWAATCRDGVVLATDSMRVRFSADGPDIVTMERKLDWIGDRIAVVASGAFSLPPHGRHYYASSPTLDRANLTVAEAAAIVAAELATTQMADPRERDPRYDSLEIPDVFEALVGGGPRGLAPELAVARGGAPVAVAPGRIVMTACMRGWCRERGLDVTIPNPAETVAEAAALAVEMTFACVTAIYRRFGHERLSDFFPAGIEPGQEGVPPGVAFPLHLAVITRDSEMTLSVPDPSQLSPATHAAA